MSKINVTFLNNEGGGFAGQTDAEAGESLDSFLSRKVSGYDPGRYLIRVNREEARGDMRLEEGMRISLTPQKIAGA
jgi:hypothetical protein